MTNEKFLTLEQVAEILQVSVRSLYRYITEGKIKATKVGYWRISQTDLKEFVKNNSNLRKRKK
jgi:excisionase family DNA binding protein